jgi:hypothetical protein
MFSQHHQTRILNFGGMEWYVRSGIGNPANNHWSDSQSSVWVDTENRLHLKIRKVNGIWHSAEIRSLHRTTYGTHRFYISSNIEQLDKNVVGAVFIYKDDTHEMDVEFSKWKQNVHPNTQYVVQPELSENMHRFQMNLSGNYTTHIIDWQEDKISYKSIYGHYLQQPDNHYLINRWIYQKKQLIDDGLYRIHINLWLVDNLPPSDNKEAELIISSIDTPISPIEISGVTTKNISMYPNHYYDHIFVYCHQNTGIKYSLKNANHKIVQQENISHNYFFVNMIDLPIGKYQLKIVSAQNTYDYTIIKNY